MKLRYIWFKFFVSWKCLEIGCTTWALNGPKIEKTYFSNLFFAFQSIKSALPNGTLMKPKVSVSNQWPKITHFQHTFFNISKTGNQKLNGTYVQ